MSETAHSGQERQDENLRASAGERFRATRAGLPS